MVRTKKMGVIVAVALLFVIFAIVIFGIIDADKYEFETSDISHYYEMQAVYNDQEENIRFPFFPVSIPDSATTTYHYYRYFSTVDIYLELSFEDESVFQTFVDSILKSIDENDLVVRENVFDNGFTEYFYTPVSSSSTKNGTKERFFELKYYNDSHLGGNYYSLNVSSEDKVVIVSYSQGKFETKRYVPMCLKRFEIPADENLNLFVSFDAP